jgi:hypothetical protein
MSKITYKALFDNTSTAVYLDGKRIGEIRCPMSHENRSWTYHPKGGTPGDAFPTLAACKASLEAE